MKGLNRFGLRGLSGSMSRSSMGVKCVFISHQKRDADVCRKIADYLINAGVDVYFDEYDSDLKDFNQREDPKQVVEAIKNGINKSSHMLCVISPNTMYSKWVPWEIGYGYDKTKVSVLTLKGIPDKELPEYLKTVPIVRGTKSLNTFIANIEDQLEQRMFSRGLLVENSMSFHPLAKYLDWNL